ncbi:MAG: DUF4065 domain-containing protein [Gammaproteobacteria bacterium]|nr:DUF4065 domain-containing protein [Gammaproteobacteria bacterium]
MVTVFDVAAFVLREKEMMTAMKLQKLVYYCQAWSLVWDEAPLFSERIEAWANGPVARELYEAHKGKFQLNPGDISGNPDTLSAEQRETMMAVLRDYGNKSSQWLSDLTHCEAPWQEARRGLAPGERGDREISHADIYEYYQAVYTDGIDIEA